MFSLFGGDKREDAPRPKGRLAFTAQAGAEAALVEWAYGRVALLSQLDLYATAEVAEKMRAELALDVKAGMGRLDGGEMQLGAEVAAGRIRALFYFLAARPLAAEPDPRPVLSLAAARGTPVALNASTAELIATSPLFSTDAAAGRRPTPSPDALAADARAGGAAPGQTPRDRS